MIALVAGSGSYIVRLSVRDLHGPTKSKQVNVVLAQEIPSSSKSENEMSETTLPNEISGSSDGSGKSKYFDLLSSTSEDDGSNSNSDGDE